MQISFLENSTFFLMDQDLIVLDCFREDISPAGIPAFLTFRRVFVLASHAHGDHFSPAIFRWRRQRADIQYILSSDIQKNIAPADATFLENGGRYSAENFSVRAFGSTDAGVSFLLEKDGKRIFHAGDFNFWHWQDEGDAAWTAAQRRAFDENLDEMALAMGALDAAMFPADPRMGGNFEQGAVEFAQRIAPKVFIPMHFGTQRAKLAAFMQRVSADQTVAVPAQPGFLLEI